MRFHTIIFDLDGTLVDSLEDLCDSVNAVLTAGGYPPRDLDEVRAFIGNGAKKLVERSLPAGTAEAETARALEAFQKEYQRRLLVKTHPYPGIPELLKSLKAQGMKVAMLSNKPHDAAVSICEGLFPGVFDLCWGARPGIPKKPDPTAVLLAMKELGTQPEQTAYVGDSEPDIRTAKNAGICSVGVSWGFRSREILMAERADIVCDSADELERFLMQKP